MQQHIPISHNTEPKKSPNKIVHDSIQKSSKKKKKAKLIDDHMAIVTSFRGENTVRVPKRGF